MQTSEGFLLLQSTTCWRTNIEPVSRWARGAVFWADSEAKVQIAPSGMMKKRKDGFVILSHSSSALASAVSVIVGIASEFFRVMSSIVSIVSWAVILWQNLSYGLLRSNNHYTIETAVTSKPPGCRRRRP